jgi:hypothetical protein
MIKNRVAHHMATWQASQTVEDITSMTAAQRRIRLTHALWDAYKDVVEGFDFQQAFAATGCNVNAAGMQKGEKLNFQSLKQHRVKNPVR